MTSNPERTGSEAWEASQAPGGHFNNGDGVGSTGAEPAQATAIGPGVQLTGISTKSWVCVSTGNGTCLLNRRM